MRRYFVLGVKTLEVPLGPFRATFGLEPESVFGAELDVLRRWGFAAVSNDCLLLSDIGRLFVDTVSAVFFSDSERSIPHPEEPEIRAAELARSRLMALMKGPHASASHG